MLKSFLQRGCTRLTSRNIQPLIRDPTGFFSGVTKQPVDFEDETFKILVRNQENFVVNTKTKQSCPFLKARSFFRNKGDGVIFWILARRNEPHKSAGRPAEIHFTNLTEVLSEIKILLSICNIIII